MLQTNITFKKTVCHLVVMSIASLTSYTHFVLQIICKIPELFRSSYWQLRVEFHIVNQKLTVQHPRNCNSILQLTSLLQIPRSTSHCISLTCMRLGTGLTRLAAQWTSCEGFNVVPFGATGMPTAHKNKQVETLNEEGSCFSQITECLTVTLLQILTWYCWDSVSSCNIYAVEQDTQIVLWLSFIHHIC